MSLMLRFLLSNAFYHVIDIKDADISYLMINGVDEKGAIEHAPNRKDRCRETRKIADCRD